MSEYIKRKDAIERFTYSIMDIKKVLKSLPSEDVVSVVYGEWVPINKSEFDTRFKCSNCGNVDTPLVGYKWCPYCGAKMNGGINNGKT